MRIESYSNSDEPGSYSPNNQARLALTNMGLGSIGLITKRSRNRGTQTSSVEIPNFKIWNDNKEIIKILAISIAIMTMYSWQKSYFESQTQDLEKKIKYEVQTQFDKIRLDLNNNFTSQEIAVTKIHNEIVNLINLEALKFEITNKTASETKFKLSDQYDKFVKLESKINDLKQEIIAMQKSTCAISSFKP